jgi:multiple sugar transport system permease protein
MDVSSRLNKLSPYMFLAPALVVMAVGSLYPVLYSARLSFFDWSLGTPWANREFVGLENYTRIFTDPSVFHPSHDDCSRGGGAHLAISL